MFIESIVPAPTPGAARTLDITWPGILSIRPGNGTVVGAIASMTRQASQGPLSNTTAQKIDGVGSSITWGTGTGYLGRAAVIFRPGTGAPGTGAAQSMDPMTIVPNFGPAANQNDNSQTDDWACFRLMATMSFQPQPSYAAFTGIGCVALNAGNVDMVQGGAKGFGFCQTADQVISFIIVTNIGGGIASSTVVWSGADPQPWSSYEMRIIGATATTNCVVKVLVNGRNIASFDWIAANFPNPQHSNGVYGFAPYIMAHGAGIGGGNAGLAVDKVRYMVGPTEASLL